MKYSIYSRENDQLVAVIDDPVVKGALGPAEEVRVEVSADRAICSNGAMRVVTPFIRLGSDRSILLSTEVGQLSLRVERGVESAGAARSHAAHRALKSSMPGKILKICCAAGDAVTAGQPLLVIEAMKMENEISAPLTGLIEKIEVVVGQSVQAGDLLLHIGLSQ